jgi:hypothetical protein
MLDVSISMYIGIAIAGCALVLYVYGMMFPTKAGDYDEAHKIFAWCSAVAFANLLLQSNMLADMGNFLRWDGLEFKYIVWTVTTISVLPLSYVITSHGWHDFQHGHYCALLFTVSSLFMIFAGLSCSAARYSWFAYGVAALVMSFYYGFFKANWTVDPPDGRKNSFRRNMMLAFIALVYFFFAFNVAIFFFSNDMGLHVLVDNDLRDWLLWLGTNGLTVVGLLAAVFYQPAPGKLINQRYALVPTADGNHMAAVDASRSNTKPKNS